MNPQFYELPQEKQQRILNAAYEVFAQNEYKRASTAEIAARAGISKGLLFHYFHSKRTLYIFLLEYAVHRAQAAVQDEAFADITDFFALKEYAVTRKIELMREMPALMGFVLQAYNTTDPAVHSEVQAYVQQQMAGALGQYYNNIDMSRFKPGTNPAYVMQLLTWLSEGYMAENRRIGKALDYADILAEYRRWAALLKRTYYKEEYWDGND